MSDFTLGKLFSPSASLSILYEITFARQTSSTLKIDGDGCKQHFLKIWRSKKKIRRVIKILFWNSKDSLTSCKDANHCMKNSCRNCRCHFLNCENYRENAKSQNKNIGLGVVVGQMVKFNINRGCDSFKKCGLEQQYYLPNKIKITAWLLSWSSSDFFAILGRDSGDISTLPINFCPIWLSCALRGKFSNWLIERNINLKNSWFCGGWWQ